MIGHLAAINLLLLGITAAHVGDRSDDGVWHYPTAIYYHHTWHAVPFWQYFLLVLVLFDNFDYCDRITWALWPMF